MVVSGRIEKAGEVEAYLFKDEKTNTVRISERGTYTKTILEPLRFSQKGSYTLVEAELVTGKTHQLRAHLSCLGHPIAGDPKYGDPAVNERLRKKGVRSQLLCCCRVEFPEEVPHLPSLSGRVVETGMPAVFNTVMQE
jgi:23S rRNA pseudouridine955/2504/2580 synthase